MAYLEQWETLIGIGRRRAPIFVLAMAFFFVMTIVLTPSAQTQTLTVIHDFTGGRDGSGPQAGLTMDVAGDLYGTATLGGSAGLGTVFRLQPVESHWIFTPLYSFKGGDDGAIPITRVVRGTNGILYGTTARGGHQGCNTTCGTVFSLRPPATPCHSALCSWSESVLYRFNGGSDGYYPNGEPVFDAAGNIFGTTQFGGAANEGTVFELMPSGGGWTESVLYTFPNSSTDGYLPNSGVVLDQAGSLYGTTYYGGASGAGTIYQLSSTGSGWSESILHDFSGADDGGNPVGHLIFDPLGNLYGTTPTAGLAGGGTVFMLASSGSNWMFTTLSSLPPGTGSYGSPIMDTSGNVYGTTFSSGLYGFGSVFELTPSGGGWTYTVLHDFTGGSDGGNPWGNVTLEPNGKLYGTTSGGGSYGHGVVFEIAP